MVERRRTIAPLIAKLMLLGACYGEDPFRPPESRITTPPNFKVAFIADQGNGADARDVLELIGAEGSDMVVHSGDLDYEENPFAWDNAITGILGEDFPYFVSVGNHDDDDDVWYGAGGYQEKLQRRVDLNPDASCSGDLGVKSSCTYRGIFLLLSGVGTEGSGHEAHIRDALDDDDSNWRICSWHKNQREMQVGASPSEVGWGPYEACREYGAIIATGHEHNYSRTKTLVNTEFQTVDPDWQDPNRLNVRRGATFVFVSGLGGRSIHNQERCLPTSYPYGCNGEWANIYSSDQDANYGALFIDFNVNGDPTTARGYFKNVDGEIVDEFTIESGRGS